MSSDMRFFDPPEKADILVSELLGSFGDNELSPECLDGAQKFLKSTAPPVHQVHVSSLWNTILLFYQWTESVFLSATPPTSRRFRRRNCGTKRETRENLGRFPRFDPTQWTFCREKHMQHVCRLRSRLRTSCDCAMSTSAKNQSLCLHSNIQTEVGYSIIAVCFCQSRKQRIRRMSCVLFLTTESRTVLQTSRDTTEGSRQSRSWPTLTC